MKKIFLAILVLSFMGACARSKKYTHEQKVYEDYSWSYYSDQPNSRKSPTHRFAKLGQPKKRVVVFQFWNDTPVNHDKKIGGFAADELRRGLHLTKRMIIPKDIKVKLETKDFIENERVRVAQLIREGRRMGVAILIIGRIAKVVFRQRGDDVGIFKQKQSLSAVDVEVKIFDVQGGREVAAVGHAGKASSNNMVAIEDGDISSPKYRAELAKFAIRDAVKRMVPDVITAIEKMSWQGRIAKIAGKKVYVNAGRASGIVAGDILKVLTPGDDIYDPTTGALLGRTPGHLKGTLEVHEFIGKDGSVAKMHTGGQFAKGDVVKLY